MSEGYTVEEIDEMILARLRLGAATIDQIRSALVPNVESSWLITRMGKLKELGKVSQVAGSYVVTWKKEGPLDEPKATEAVPPPEKTEPTMPTTSSPVAKTIPSDLDFTIMEEVKNKGEVSIKGFQDKYTVTTSKLYAALNFMVKERRLTRKKVGKAYHWRLPPDEGVPDKSPEVKTPKDDATITRLRGITPPEAPPRLKMETKRTYHIPLADLLRRFPEIVGEVKTLSVAGALKLLLETEEVEENG